MLHYLRFCLAQAFEMVCSPGTVQLCSLRCVITPPIIACVVTLLGCMTMLFHSSSLLLWPIAPSAEEMTGRSNVPRAMKQPDAAA